MNKFEFSTELRAKLWSVPPEDARRSVDYYSEMIDDRMEEGLTEEEAVAAIGDLDEIVKNILAEMPRTPVATEAPKKRRGLRVWEIILLILGAPLWIPVVTGVVSAVLSVYISLWTVVAVLYVADVAVGTVAIGCIVGFFFMIGRPATASVTLGAALLCTGIAILVFLLGNLAAKGMVALTKLAWQGCKRLLKGKEQSV